MGQERKALLPKLSDRLFLDEATFADVSGSDGLAPEAVVVYSQSKPGTQSRTALRLIPTG